ncbi:MAG: UDP-N-acetylmuramate dehydrogenase [Clostridia bacterium]|nr:UDP-N-acetylmuramate dehydrogenase [Clostridia bacterium]
MKKKMGEYRSNAYESFAQIQNFDLSKYSSIGIGKKAELVFCPQSVAECVTLLQRLQKDTLPYCVLGNLTNVLPPDEPMQKAIVLTKNLNGIKKTDKGVFAYAGVKSGEVLRFCRQNEYSGIEFLQGVPCTLGGALFMNAGVSGRYMDDVVDEVLVYRDGKTRMLSKTECQYSYKKSVFMRNQDVILGASLRLQKATVEEINAKEKAYACKRAHLPKGRSMGCVFKNPEGYTAGVLIEKCGLKGKRVGGAVVAQEHANFILNDNGATCRDVQTLMEIIKQAVLEKFGVSLEEEIRRI